ncbi:WD40-repeat-containing domain protein [Pyronema domesticum]|uniref:Similar to Uncharacterized WD repeat-containing protein C577.09 acc. no. Q9USR0 n=1 Tax=Pyronema omphalodes (strain CBS 100304) TaxID=1076935 RepID=U4LPK7_PYROM|nr:WD40-repeat-containing domain protein [Pyronema domesticum]CCX34101.1 Similar to Uncharacterized WD repeat-containing protein C577.09; acc. no. Q9USR0 [Pyronema omphalodes CBS 100304]
MLNQYLFARELGNPVSRQLEMYENNRLWHCLTRDEHTSFQTKELEKGVNCMDIERQQRRFLLSGQANGSVCMWDLEKSTSTDAGQDVDPDEKFLSPTATVTASKDTHTHSLTSLHYYPIDAGMFLTTAFDRRLLVWDTSTLEPAFSTTFAHAPTSISISPMGHHTLVAVASPGPEVRLVDLASGSSVRSLGTGGTASVRWSERDGWLLMAGSTEGEVSIWDVRMARGCLGMLGERRGRVTRGHEGPVNGITFSEDGRYVVTSGRDKKIKVWDLATGADTLIAYPPLHRPHRIFSSNPILTPQITSDPQLLFVPSIDEVIGFDFLRGDVLVKSRAVTQKHTINALIARPNHCELYFGCSGGEIGIMKAPELRLNEDGEEKEENVLNRIYKSLVQEPITFT